MTKKESDDKVVKIDNKKNKKAVEEFDGLISKIKIKKDIPEIFYKKDGEKSSKTIIIKGKEKPLDSFLEAMQDLKEFFVNICEIENKKEHSTIIVVSFSEKGVIVTGQYELLKNGLKVPLTINSPLIKFDKNVGGYQMSKETKQKFEQLKFEAIQYIKGEFADKQQSLFEGVK